MSPTDGHQEPRRVYKTITLGLQQLSDSLLNQSPQQPQLDNAIQHLLWVLNYLPELLPEQPFHQYVGGPRREEVQRLQQIVETFLLQLLSHVSKPSTSQPPLCEQPSLHEQPHPGLLYVPEPDTQYQLVPEQSHPELLQIPQPSTSQSPLCEQPLLNEQPNPNLVCVPVIPQHALGKRPSPGQLYVSETKTPKPPLAELPPPGQLHVSERDTLKPPLDERPSPGQINVSKTDTSQQPLDERPSPGQIQVSKMETSKPPLAERPLPGPLHVSELDTSKTPLAERTSPSQLLFRELQDPGLRKEPPRGTSKPPLAKRSPPLESEMNTLQTPFVDVRLPPLYVRQSLPPCLWKSPLSRNVRSQRMWRPGRWRRKLDHRTTTWILLMNRKQRCRDDILEKGEQCDENPVIYPTSTLHSTTAHLKGTRDK